MKNFNHRLLKKASMIAVSLLLLSSISYSQNSVSIGSENIKTSAVLYLQGNGSQGLIIPIVTNVSGIAAPEAGMIVYQSSDSQVYYHNGTGWSAFSGGGGTDSQTLTINGNTLSITNGNSVSLSGANPSTAGQLFMWDGSQWTASKTTAPTNGQVLQWDGTTWTPATINGTAYTAGSGINIDGGNVISNTGDTDATDDITDATTLGGDLSGTLPNPTIAAGAVTDAKILNVAPSKLTQEGALSGQVLRWNTIAGKWEPATVAVGAVTSLSDLTDANVIAPLNGQILAYNLGTLQFENRALAVGDIPNLTLSKITDAGALAGADDVSSAQIVDGSILAADLNNMGAATGQVLKWNGTNWAASADDVGSGSLPTINNAQVLTNDGVSNVAVTVSGDITFANDGTVTISGNAVNSAKIADGSITDTDISDVDNSKVTGLGALALLNTVGSTEITDGSITNVDIANVDPSKVLQSGATSGQVLKWNGSQWAPASDDVGGGSLPAITNAQLLTNDGASNIAVSVSGDVTFANDGTVTIANNAVNSAKIADGSITNTDISDVDNSKVTGLGALALLSTVGSTEITDGSIQAADLNSMGATTGQTLEWNGTTWAPVTAAGGGTDDQLLTYTPGTNILDIESGNSVDLSDLQQGLSLSTAGTSRTIDITDGVGVTLDVADNDNDATNELQSLSIAGTDITLSNGGGTVSVNDADADVTNELVSGVAVNGNLIEVTDAGGTQSAAISGIAPASGQVLKWNGTAWAAAADDVGGGGLPALTNAQIVTNDGVSNVPVTVGGDVEMDNTGSVNILNIQGTPVSMGAPASGQVLKWDGAQWAPATDDVGGGGLPALLDAQILTNNGSNVAVTVSGDVTLANDGTVTISNDAVTSAKIADGSIANADISDVDNSKVTGLGALALLGSVGSIEITDGAVTSADIANGTISNIDIADVDPAKINQSGATPSQVLKWDGAQWAPAADDTGAGVVLTNAQIITNDGATDVAVTVSGDVTLANDGTITISAGAVNSAKIADGSITDADISDVDNSKVTGLGALALLGTVGSAEITDGAVTSADIADLTISSVDISDIDPSKINQAGATPSQVLKWDGAEWAPAADAAGSTPTLTNAQIITNDGATDVAVTVSGDVTFVNDGTITISAGAVNSAKIADGSITNADISDVDNSKVTGLGALALLGTVGSAEITDGAVTSADIADLTISSVDISDIDPSKINQAGATPSQVLKWDGAQWAPAADAAGSTPTLTNAQIITNDGATDVAVTVSGDVTFANDGTITISADAVNSAKIADGSITDADISDVDNSKVTGLGALALLGTVTSTEIADGSIGLADLSGMGAAAGEILKWDGVAWGPAVDDAASTPALADAQIITNDGATDIAVTISGDVTLANDGTVTIANDAITSAKIAPGTIGLTDLSGMGAAAGEILKWDGVAWGPAVDDAASTPALTDAQLITNDGATDIAITVSGDITLANDGTVTISADAVNSAKIADGSITDADIADVDNSKVTGLGALALLSSVSSTEILDGTILAVDLNNMGAAVGESLTWDGVAWVPTASSESLQGSYDGGNSIQLAAADNISITKNDASALLYLDESTGNVGIGTAAPTSALDVAGAATISGTINGNFLSAGEIQSNATGQNALFNLRVNDAGVTRWYMGQDLATRNYFIGYENTSIAGADLVIDRTTGNVGLGTSTPAVSLDINATDAIQLPFGTTAERPGTPANGMFRYNSDTPSFEGYVSGAWTNLGAGTAGWGLTGNAGTVDGTDFIGTTDNVALSFRVNNLNSGRIDPLGPTFLGVQAGNVNTDGSATGIGFGALSSNTTGILNTAVGRAALENNTTGAANVAVGYLALRNSNGNNNTAVGSNALISNVAGSANTGIGSDALNSNTSGGNNIGVGANALGSNTNASESVAIGNSALAANTTGGQNTAVGHASLQSNIDGTGNVGVGLNSLFSSTNASGNTALGYASLLNSTSSENTAVGINSLIATTTGANNVAIGAHALAANTTGFDNVALGYNANVSLPGLNNAIAIGANATVDASNKMVLGISGTNIQFDGELLPAGAAGTAGQVLTSAGPGATPTWAAAGGGFSTLNAVPRGDGAGMVAGSIYDDGTFVGIGTATPGTKLDVAITGGGTAIRAFTDTNNLNEYALSAVTSGTGDVAGYFDVTNPASGFHGIYSHTIGSGSGIFGATTGTGNAATFWNFNAANTSSVVQINNNGAGPSLTTQGSVGIGTNAPTSELHVIGDNTGGVLARVQNNNSAGWAGVAMRSDVANFSITTAGSTAATAPNSLYVFDGGAGAPRFIIDPTGKIAVGPAMPSVMLDIQGTDGIQLPVGTTAQQPGTPAAGMLRFNLDNTAFEGYDGTSWSSIGGSGWGLVGNAGTIDGTNFIGTTDVVPLNFRMNNQPSGRIDDATSGVTTFGYQAGNIGAGFNNVAFGFRALASNTGDGNAAFGSLALENQIAGAANTALGYATLRTSAGTQNTAVGNSAMENHLTGADNVAVGYLALLGILNASGNTGVGSFALQNTDGQGNTGLGYFALNTNTTGTFNTAIGHGADVSAPGLSNATVIGSGASVGASNSIVLGSGENVGIGISTPHAELQLPTTTVNRKLVLFEGADNDHQFFGFGVNPSAMRYQVNGTFSDHIFYASTTTTTSDELVRIQGDGNVGIGIAAPTELLDVAGNVKFSGALMPNNLPGAAGEVLTSAGPGVAPTWAAAGGSGWGILGNAGTIDGTNFIGTTDNVALNFRVNNEKAGRIDPNSSNTFMGRLSGDVNTATNNTGFGYRTLANNTTGVANSAFGVQALEDNTTATGNTAFGYFALTQNVDGFSNTAIGQNALSANVSGGFNVALGVNALQSNTAGQNTGVGFESLKFNTTGTRNTSTGYFALRANIDGDFNTATGYTSLDINTSGSGNTAYGFQSGDANTTGSNNTFLGYNADAGSPTLSNATAIGANAIVNVNDRLVLGATGTDIEFDGELRPADDPGTVGQFLTSGGPGVTPTWTSTAASLISDAGGNNIFVGNSSGTNTTGNNNTFVGDFTGTDNTTGTDNVYVGTIAGQRNVTGGFNVLVGRGAGANMTSGGLNTMIGFNSGFNADGTAGNTFLGGTSGQNSTADLNTLIGEKAGTNLTTGGANSYLGRQTGVNNTTGWYNTFIGSEATSTVDGLFRSVAIGYNAQVGQSNAMALGGTGADAVNVGINTELPTARLTVVGNAIIGAINTVASDGYAFGENNSVSGTYAFAIGTDHIIGSNGHRSMAFGNHMRPNHLGAFMIGDYSGDSPGITASSATDQFTARFNGGYRFYSSSDPISNPTEAVFLTSTGLGIDRNAAVNALEVNGNASKTTATAWLANSDRRIKTDIQDIEGSLETMMKLRPVKFKYTQEWMDRYPTIEDRYYHNFIAQEYQEVFPNAVQGSGEYVEGDGNEVLQIDTYDAQITTIKAVQELIKKVETLEKENTELKTELAESKASISELSAKTAQNSEVSSNTSEIERLKAELASIKSLLLNNVEKAKEDK